MAIKDYLNIKYTHLGIKIKLMSFYVYVLKSIEKKVLRMLVIQKY